MFFMDFATARRLQATKFVYTLAGSVPALNAGNGGALLIEEKIQAGYGFWSELLAMTFTTLANDGTDDGVNYITTQFRDGAVQLAMSNAAVDIATLAAPGRQRAIGVAGDPSNSLQVDGGVPWPHLWAPNGSIQADCRNGSNTANLFRATFHGYLIPERNMTLFDQWMSGQSIAAGQGRGLTKEQTVQALMGLLNQ